MLKYLLAALGIVFAFAFAPMPSVAMLGDKDWAKEDVGSVFPPPVEEEEAAGLLINGCWESRDPIEQFNPIWIPTRSPDNPYEFLPGVLDTETGDKLAKLCNCQAMVSCDALLVTRFEVRPQKKRQRVITEVIAVTPDVPFQLIP